MRILPLRRNTIKLAGSTGHPIWSIGGAFGQFLSHDHCPYYVLVQNVEYEDNDVVLPIVAVDDHRVLYGFGKDFGKLFITGLICVPTSSNGKTATNLINQLNKGFASARSTKQLRPINISGAMGFRAKAYLIGMRLHSADPRTNTIHFTLTGLVAPVSNRNRSKL